jgi:hypothetical protein
MVIPVSNASMRWFRFTRIVGLVIISVFIVYSAYIQIEQHRLRRTAERVLGEMRSLEPGKATADGVKQVVQKWGFEPSLMPGQTCTDEHCDYALWMTTPAIPRVLTLYGKFGPGHWTAVLRLLTALGRRDAEIYVYLGVRHGMLRLKDFSVQISVPAERGEAEVLVGRAGNWSGDQQL